MILQYFPTDKISIDKVVLEFSESRDSVRTRLHGIYEENNEVIQMGAPGIDPIYQRRDIYKNINSTDNYFFLCYDENDSLSEVEVHHCEKIKVLDASFGFDDSLDSIVSKLKEHSSAVKKSDGEYFFKELKVVVIDKEYMGGEGSALGYFYCSSDVTHLQDDIVG